MQNTKPFITTVLAALLCLITACTRSQETKPSNNLRNSVEAGTRPEFAGDEKAWDTTRQMYTLRQFEPAWSNAKGVSPSADAALKVLENAAEEGLNPEEFGASELRAMRDGLANRNDSTPPSADEFELRLSYALMRYASQLCFGRVNPTDVVPNWPKSERSCDVAQIVQDALANNTVESLAEQLSPRIPEYAALKMALASYRDIEAKGGWQPLNAPAGKKTTASFDAMVQERLAVAGDADLKSFQARHGIEPDGRPGPKTVSAMNVPVRQRIEQIAINLDRLRWIADRLEPQHIRVNIPGFELTVHDGDQIPLRMRAIVGSKDNATPVLDGVMEYLVFSPYWNIPLSIAQKELLPKIQKNPRYLEQENIEVIRGSGDKAQVINPSKIDWDNESDLEGFMLRQKPGTKNALGLVKFIFPNPYNVYLHDTPADNLFDRLTRTLSHGCVRLEQPKELAAYVLSDQPEWTPEAIDMAMHAEKEKRVNLKTKIPVHLLYWTAWMDADGLVQFRDDVYGYDEKHRQLIKDGATLPAPNAANIDVNELGTGVVPDSSGLHGESRLSK